MKSRGLSLWCSSLETTASGVVPSPMVRGMDVEARESLPATVPDETVLKTIEVRSHLYPAQDGIFDKKRSLAKGAFVLHDSSVNGKAGEAWTKAQVASAESAAVEADAKAKAEVAKARVAEAVAVEAEAKARVAEAEATTKVRVAAAEALEADLKILKLRKEIDVFTGESEVKEYLCVSVSPSVSLSVAHCLFF